MPTTQLTTVRYDPSIESTLHLITELRSERVEGIKRAAKFKVFQAARDSYPKAKLIMRDMTPQDLGVTNLEWVDTTATANAYEDSIVASATIGDGRFVCVYGLHALSAALVDLLPVTALKFTVGGAIVGQWDIHRAWPALPDGITIGNIRGPGRVKPGMITESPIVISQNIEVTISQWAATTTTIFSLVLDGYTCEIEGKTLRP